MSWSFTRRCCIETPPTCRTLLRPNGSLSSSRLVPQSWEYNPVTDGTIATARRWFAEELRHTAHVCSESVIEAFATVPREHFAGPGPWRILSPMHLAGYWTSE